VAHYSSGDLSILLGDGSGNFSSPTNFSAAVSGGFGFTGLVVGAFNHDNKQDIAIANPGGGQELVSILLRDCQATPTPTPTPQPSPTPTATATATPTPTPTPAHSYSGQVQPPINADGTSVFTVKRGVVPVKFRLTDFGSPTCALPPATIAVTRTAGGVMGEINESVYSGPADNGSNFRIDGCQYIYNLSASSLGIGTYRLDIKINNQVVGSATFELK